MEEIPVERKRGRKSLVNLGLFIKDYLIEYSQACQQDIHSAYRNKLRSMYEAVSRRYTRHSGMTYHSFTRYFQFIKRLGFVEKTGEVEESMLQVDYHKAYPNKDIQYPRTFYKLTDKGMEATDAEWSNPLRTLYPQFDAKYYSYKSREYAAERKAKGLPSQRRRLTG